MIWIQRGATTHQWLSSSSLKGQIEGFILVDQDQSISTQAYQSRILNNGADPICRLWTERKKTVDHVASACPTIVNTEYLQRHDQVASFIHWISYKDLTCPTQKNGVNIHWILCKNFNLPHTEKWYKHTLDII